MNGFWSRSLCFWKKNRLISLISAILVLAAAAAGAEEATPLDKINSSIAVFRDVARMPEKGIPNALLRQAKAIVIIPEVVKMGFIFAGRYGEGVLLIRDPQGQWENPIFVEFVGGSVGWQFGLQSTDVILIFKSMESVDSLRQGEFTLGIDAAIAAGPVGRQAEAGTNITMRAEIYSYSRSQGMFAGISLEGSSLKVAYQKTLNFYGRSLADMNNWDLRLPAEVEDIKKVLAEYAGI